MAAGILVPGSNGQTPALIADRVLSYPSQNGLPASGPGGVASFTTVDVGGIVTPISAALELQSTTGALVIPRMTTAQKNALVADEGMVVFDTDIDVFFFYQGGNWTQFAVSSGGGSVIGPGTSTTTAIALWGNGAGSQLTNSAVLISNTGTISQNGAVVNSEIIVRGSNLTAPVTPAFSFEGTNNLGMYQSAPNTLAFAANGARQFQITGANTADNYLIASGSAAGASLTIDGADANPEFGINLKGTGQLAVRAGTNAAGVAFYEPSAAGTSFVGFKAPANVTTSVQWSLPVADGTAGQVLTTSGVGGGSILSFTSVAGNVIGPGPAVVDNSIARFNGTGGLTIVSSAVTIDDTTGKITITGGANGVVQAGNGAVNLAAYGFASDVDTGMWLNGAGTLDFISNGTTQFRVGPLGGATNFATLLGSVGDTPAVLNTTASAGTNVGLSIITQGDSGLEIHSDNNVGSLRIFESAAGTNYVGFKAPAALTGNTVWQLPATDGTAGQVLSTAGGAVLQFINALTVTAPVTDRSIVVFNGTAGAVTQNSLVTIDAVTGTITNTSGGSAGKILMTTGTQALPAYSFIGDPDSGMWSGGVGTLNFSSNALLQFAVRATASANRSMFVAGGNNASGSVIDSNPSLNVTGTGADINLMLVAQGTGGAVGIRNSETSTEGVINLYETITSGNSYIQLSPAANMGANYGFRFPATIGTAGQSIVCATVDSAAGGKPATMNFQFAANFAVTDVPSSVNFLQETTAATGNNPILGSTGTDTNVGINLLTKGTGLFNFATGNGTQLQIADSGAAATSWLAITGGTGVPGTPTISAQGAGADINVVINTKGTAGLALSNSTIGGTLALLNPAGTAACAITVDPAFMGEHNIQLPSITAPVGGTYVLAATRVDASNTTLSYVSPALQTATGTLSSANLLAMSASPVQILAAPGANLLIKILLIEFELVAGGTPYAGGGNVIAQYSTTALGAGPAATLTVPASSITAAVDTMSAAGPTSQPLVKSLAANQPVYISNQTAAFTAGNGTVNYTIFYKVLSVV